MKLFHAVDSPFTTHTITLRNIHLLAVSAMYTPGVLLLSEFFRSSHMENNCFLIRAGSPEGKDLALPSSKSPQDSAHICHSFVLTSGSPLGTS